MQRSIPSRLVSLALILITQTIVCLAQDKLSGTATVSPTGAATYSVAIEAPKGVGDLMPSIGITYNSQAGNGLVGFGYNITGLSAITRGVKTIAHDNTVKGIDYNSNNCALYLDGKRLLLKSGTEGTDGCVYAPEGEPLTNVTLHNSLTSTSCWFEVDTNDGMVYEFGHSDGRQYLNNNSAVATWYINKATNPMGQTITYFYYADGLYLYPETIYYNGSNTINFTYENRSDSIFFTLGNSRGYVGKRLKSISTKTGNSTFRTYTMSYNNTYDGSQTKFSRLTTIHETGEGGRSSHDLTALWNYMPSFSETCHQSVVNPPSGTGLVQYGYRYLLAGDMNNDGISDIIHISPVQLSDGSYIEVRAYKSHITDGSISFQSSQFGLPLDYQIADIIGQKGSAIVVDINGDGKNDFAYPYLTNNTYSNAYIFRLHIVVEGLGSESTPDMELVASHEMPLYTITDVNGNGRNEIVALEKQGINNQYTLHLMEYTNHNGIPYYCCPLNCRMARNTPSNR